MNLDRLLRGAARDLEGRVEKAPLHPSAQPAKGNPLGKLAVLGSVLVLISAVWFMNPIEFLRPVAESTPDTSIPAPTSEALTPLPTLPDGIDPDWEALPDGPSLLPCETSYEPTEPHPEIIRQGLAISLFFQCGDVGLPNSVVQVFRHVSSDGWKVEDAIRSLFLGPTEDELAAGLRSGFGISTAVLDIEVYGAGVTTHPETTNGVFVKVAAGDGQAISELGVDSPLTSELLLNMFQFPEIDFVKLMVGNACLVGDGPPEYNSAGCWWVDRAEWEKSETG